MNNVLGVATASALLVSSGAFADAGLQLAQAKQCLTCHDVYVPARAPSFRSISTKYNGRNATKAQVIGIEQTIKKGSPDAGGYHWPLTTMPIPGTRPIVSDAEAAQLTRWILGLK